MEKEALIDLLFDIFEKRKYADLKLLVSSTNQPMVRYPDFSFVSYWSINKIISLNCVNNNNEDGRKYNNAFFLFIILADVLKGGTYRDMCI